MGTWSKLVISVCGVVAVGCGGKDSAPSGTDAVPDQGTVEIEAEVCQPNCIGKVCGDDGCGGDCGMCAEGEACSEVGVCECVPCCQGKDCGPDCCGGTCGVCVPGVCCFDGICCCVPEKNCEGRECGDDGCGGSCGECGENTTCVDGQCQCLPKCDGNKCGDDGCGGTCSCDDGVDCTADGCGADSVCEHIALDTLCDDGNPCTVDVCSSETGCSNEGISFGACGPRDSCVAGECMTDPHPEGVVSARGNSCVVKPDGTVWCWGTNDHGQLGLGAPSDEVTTPVQVAGLSGVWRVAASSYHACALKDDGTVWCWGKCPYEQCGCSNELCLEPIQVIGPSEVVALESESMDCALTAKGKIWCWGLVYDKSAESWPYAGSLPPMEVPLVNDAVDLTTDGGRLCFVDGTRALWCLLVTADKHGPMFSSPEMVQKFEASVAKVDVMWSWEALEGDWKESLTCAVLIDGTLWCWGKNAWGVQGEGVIPDSDVPVQVPGLADVVDVDVNWAHVCALGAGGVAWCWGRNDYGQLGSGSTGVFEASPQKVVGVEGVVSVSADSHHACALGQNEQVWCWGDDLWGQVGVGRVLENAPPAPVHGLTEVKGLALANRSTYALDGEGTRWAWGDDDVGQLGDGHEWLRASPVKTVTAQPVVAVGARLDRSHIAMEDGTVEWWGYPDNLLGMVVEGIPPAVGLSSGFEFSCAIDALWGVTCWGPVDDVELGVPEGTVGWEPVAGLPPSVEVTCGYSHSCARTQDGFVWCWGYGSLGQLGNGAKKVSAAVQVKDLGLSLQISAGLNSTCALKADGTVWCWGDNFYGQLGQEGVATSSLPLQVPGLEGAIAVGLGYRHACAVLGPEGTVWCWGDNKFGQLGDGTTANSFEPVQVKGVNGADGVWGGSDATCALMLDGTVWCWGNDEKGQLGREGPYKITPAPVVGFP